MLQLSEQRVQALKAGDRIWRWVHTGTRNGYDQADIQTMTVVRVNRTTVTVDLDHHGRARIPHHMINDIVDWDED